MFSTLCRCLQTISSYGIWRFRSFLGGDAGRNPLFQQAIPEPVSVIASTRKKMFGSGEIIQQFSGPFIVRHLTRRQIHEHRFSGTITNCM
jgi:hypothetical protein